LISSLSCWETAGYVGLLIVIVGVAGEGVHDFTSWFKQTWWGPHGGRAAILVLIIGLAVEGVGQVKANSTSGQIIAFLGNEAAATRERAASLEKEAVALRLQLAERTAPLVERRLRPDQIATLVSELRGHGLVISVSSVGNDHEASVFANDFITAFTEAGVLGPQVYGLQITTPRGGPQFPSGVNVTGENGPAKTKLEAALSAASIPFGEQAIMQGISIGSISVNVGSRPNLHPK
jgi:hypothetical protein